VDTTTNPASVKALLERAKHEFPVVFKKPVPLVRGAHHLLLAIWPDLSKRAIRRFLERYCASRPYLLAIAAGGPRYYLDGSPDGDVTAEEQDSARAWLEARQAKNLAAFRATLDRLKQERKARQEAAFKKGLADEAATEERPPAPSPAPPAAVPSRPSRPVLRMSTVQVRGENRQAREVQVVTKRKFARSKV
jgi:sRNA-binding protein